jgi:putative transposase
VGLRPSRAHAGPASHDREALADRPSKPDRFWNKIPDAVQVQIVELALDAPELSPRDLAVRFTDEQR